MQTRETGDQLSQGGLQGIQQSLPGERFINHSLLGVERKTGTRCRKFSIGIVKLVSQIRADSIQTDRMRRLIMRSKGYPGGRAPGDT